MNLKYLYDELARTPNLSPRKVQRLIESGLSLSQIRSRHHSPKGKAPTASFLTPACDQYPAQLAHLADPPLRLFHRGLPLDSIRGPIVAIVGSRKATRHGLGISKELGKCLAQRGVSVCSGLALGIDGACHRAVVDEIEFSGVSAPPIAVLGHGWGTLHPREHHALAQRVESHGILLTEYPPGTPATRYTFPARNRIIAALARHVVIVEAGARSGSLHTARYADQLGRTLWVVPNGLGRVNSEGVLNLIKGGVEVISSIPEFLEEVAPSKCAAPNPKTLPVMEPEERELLFALARSDGSVDQFCDSTSWSANELAYRLTSLELAGLVRRAPGGTWDVLCGELLGQLEE